MADQLRAVNRYSLKTLAVGTVEQLRIKLEGHDLDDVALYRSLSGPLVEMVTYGPMDTAALLAASRPPQRAGEALS